MNRKVEMGGRKSDLFVSEHRLLVGSGNLVKCGGSPPSTNYMYLSRSHLEL